MGRKLRILSRQDVKQSLSMEQAITLMRGAFIGLSQGAVQVPVRMNMPATEQNGELLLMPVNMPAAKRMGVKLVSIFGDNPAKDLPLIHAMFMVFNGTTGQPLALMDAEYLTALRTGAATGLATDLLANLDATIIALFGTGVQARAQLEGVCAVRAIERVHVFGRQEEKVKAFCQEMREKLYVDVVPAGFPEVLAAADVICTATTSSTPVFDDALLKEGAHINAVGAYRKDMAEIPEATVCRSKVVVDHRESCLAEAGDLVQLLQKDIISESHILAELGEVAAGKIEPRTSMLDFTLFKSVGNAVQDLAAASQVLANAQSMGLGTEVDW